MKVVGFVPSKLNSQRLKAKNIRPLKGIPLVNYILKTLNNVSMIDETIVFASENSICDYIEKNISYTYVQRPQELDTDETTVQDFIGGFLKEVDGDIIVLAHITSPFISAETLSECLHNVLSGEYDSAFVAEEVQKFAWFNNTPLNYSLQKSIPRTQDMEPVLFEQSGIYVFTRDGFMKTGRRIGDKPFIKVVDSFEGTDIDTLEDFIFAEFVLEKNLLNKK